MSEPISPLVASLIQANVDSLSRTTNTLIDSLTEQLADRDAELGAIRTRINELFAGPWMPTESAVIQAVFCPSRELIRQCRQETTS